MPTKAKEDQDIPAKVRDELRRVITVNAYGLIWTKKGMKLAEQELDIFKSFHGDATEERASHKVMLCSAQGKQERELNKYMFTRAVHYEIPDRMKCLCCLKKIFFVCFCPGPYEKLYDKIPITNNDPTSKSVQKYYFTLKPVFLGQVSTARWKTPPSYVAGDHINVGVLERSVKDKPESPFVSSRSLFNSARNCLANIREMIAVVSYWTKEGMPKKSGENWDIVLDRVLDHMWKHNEGKEQAKDTKLVAVSEIGASYKAQQEGEKGKEAAAVKERPNGWTPQGWMAFLLFGPTPYKSQLLPLTQVGDAQPKEGESKKQFGRKSHRENEAKEKDIIRNNDPQDRGMSQSHQLLAVGLQQKMLFMENMDKHTKILTNQKTLSFLEKKAERLSRIAMHRGTQEAWALYEKAEAEFNAAVENSKESPVKNEESKKAIASYLKKVLPTKVGTPMAKRRLDADDIEVMNTKNMKKLTQSPKKGKSDTSLASGSTSTSTFLVATQPAADTPSDLESLTPSDALRQSDIPLGQPSDLDETPTPK